MKTVRGDVIHLALSGHFDVIVHGCNCQCVMGKGLAKQIRKTFPAAYDADLETGTAESKLGTVSSALVQRGPTAFHVVNAYTQWHWRGAGVKTNYDAVRLAFRAIKQQFGGKRIGYPRIGAGLGGGDWAIVAAIIDEELAGEDHTLVELP